MELLGPTQLQELLDGDGAEVEECWVRIVAYSEKHHVVVTRLGVPQCLGSVWVRRGLLENLNLDSQKRVFTPRIQPKENESDEADRKGTF